MSNQAAILNVKMRPIGKFKLWQLLVVIALVIFAMIPVYMRIPEQCVLCRAERNDIHLFGFSFSSGFRDDGEFTRWYAGHRPSHEHIWRCSKPGCLADRNFLGVPLTVYEMRRHPILHLSLAQELQFVKHADEATLSRFFADAASTNLETQFSAADLARKKILEIR